MPRQSSAFRAPSAARPAPSHAGRHHRLAVCTRLLMSALFGAAPALVLWPQVGAAQVSEQQFDIDVPAQPLAQALADLSRQTGVQVFAAGELVSGKSAPAVRGRLGARAALDKLLTGSGLVASAEGGGFVIKAAPAPRAATDNELPAVRVTAKPERESAFGPVDGYAAKRSATGTKTDTPLKDIPQIVNVVGQQELRDRGVGDMGDVFNTVPGAVGGSGYGGSGSSVDATIRGFRSSADFRDGLRDFGFYAVRDIALFERVEVLKGPASVLYGTNEPGGIVNYVAKRPRFETERELGLALGSFSARRAELDLTGPVAQDGSLAYRLIAMVDDSESHRDFVFNDKRVLAPSLTWRPSSSTEVTLFAELGRQDYLFDRGFLAEPEMLGLPRERFLGEPVDRAEVASDRVLVDATHRFDADWSLRGALSWGDAELEELQFSPAGLRTDRRTLDRVPVVSRERSTDHGLQLELTGKLATAGVQHLMVAGVEHYRSKARFDFAARFDVPAPIDIYEPVYGQVTFPPGSFETVTYSNHTRSRTTAFYLQDQLTFSERWKGLVGLRYDHSRLHNDFPLSPEFSLRPQTESRTSPRVGLVYQPVETRSLFLSYSTSFNPQIYSPMASGDLPKPEVGKQIEAGWRETWLAGRLDSTLSVFDIRKENVTTADPDDPMLSIQVGEQRSRGVELELRGEPVRGVELIAGAAWLDAEVTQDNTLPVGDRLLMVPRFSSSLWLKYRPHSEGWFVGGGVFYLGKREASLPNNGIQIPAQTRLDALLGYGAGAWQLQANLRNLTNERTFGARSGFDLTPGPGRNVDVSLRYRF